MGIVGRHTQVHTCPKQIDPSIPPPDEGFRCCSQLPHGAIYPGGVDVWSSRYTSVTPPQLEDLNLGGRDHYSVRVLDELPWSHGLRRPLKAQGIHTKMTT